MNLKGKTALVTGGARGIGFAAVKRLLTDGARCVIWDRDQKAIDDAKAQLMDLGEVTSDRVELEKDLADIVEEEGAQEVVQIGNAGEGTITLELDSGAFFKPGGAELLDQAIPVLKSIYEEFASPIYEKFNVSIEGHTDDDPISSFKFPSNWELSVARAIKVAKIMMQNGVQSNRINVAGYGEFRPLVANNSKNNREKNRRIELKLTQP